MKGNGNGHLCASSHHRSSPITMNPIEESSEAKGFEEKQCASMSEQVSEEKDSLHLPETPKQDSADAQDNSNENNCETTGLEDEQCEKMSEQVVEKESLENPKQDSDDAHLVESLDCAEPNGETLSPEPTNKVASVSEIAPIPSVWHRMCTFLWWITLGLVVSERCDHQSTDSVQEEVDWDNHETRRRWNTFYLFTSLIVWFGLGVTIFVYFFEFPFAPLPVISPFSFHL